jgi:hypothetical protein
MKKIITSLLALSLLVSSCKKAQDIINPDQIDTSTGTPSGTPTGSDKPGTPTEVGKPTGAMTSQTIGTEGGSITASDGKLTLTISAGALAKPTVISVEPVENTSGLGVGSGYHFLPEGTQFAKPATFTYHYTDEEMTGADADHLAIAVQQADHSWAMTSKATINKAQHTITSQIRHFSWWSVVTQYKLTPKKTEVVPGEKVQLTLLYSGISFHEPKNDDELLGSPIIEVGNMNKLREWTVNGQLFPNQETDGSLDIDPETTPIKITYTAPKTLPAKNKRIAAISFQLDIDGSAKLLLVANIRIVSPGEITVDGTTYDDVAVSVQFGKHIDPADYNGDSYYVTMTATTKSGKPVKVLLWLKEFQGVGKYTLQGDGYDQLQHATYTISYTSESGVSYSNMYWGTCACELSPLTVVPVSANITQFDGEGGTTQGTFSATLHEDMKKDKSVKVSARFRAVISQ